MKDQILYDEAMYNRALSFIEEQTESLPMVGEGVTIQRWDMAALVAQFCAGTFGIQDN